MVLAPLATASLPSHQALLLHISHEHTQLTGETEADLHIKTENGEEAPPKQYPQQVNPLLPPPWAANLGGAMTRLPRLLLRKERPLWSPDTSLGLTAVSWGPLCCRDSQAAGSLRQRADESVFSSDPGRACEWQ